jgi:CRISPR-associated Csx2 family protein
MPHTLISFLGKSQKRDGNYSTANYDFDGHIETTQFFSLGLKNVIKPERLVILGTSGSMWDVLFDNFASAQEYEDQKLELIDAVEHDKVTQVQLTACESLLKEQMGIDCQLKLIPYGDSKLTQVEILQIMAQGIAKGDQVSLDLTHGLRHLPMLGLLSAMYLQTAKKVEIKGIYYGALDRTPKGVVNPLTPVMRLDGLLQIADWITALHGFEKTGDIAPFSDLLIEEGVMPSTAGLLKEAAFYENTLSVTRARKPLRDFTKQTSEGLPGIASLFQDSLNERISWIDQDNIYLRQREKAQFYLQQSDYVRAAALGYEALITRHLKQKNPLADSENYDLRDEIKQKLKKQADGGGADYKLLRNIRNSLAHANRNNIKEVQQALSSDESLKQKLSDLFITLLPPNLQ